MRKPTDKPRSKVWIPTAKEQVPFVAPRRFQREIVKGVDRLLVSTDRDWCRLMLAVLGPDGDEYYCLYELRDKEDGRTQAGPMSYDELVGIVEGSEEFLESDPRHNFWAFHGTSQVVLDEHNFLFVYGDLEATAALLMAQGFEEGPVELPSPHLHYYLSDDGSEARLIKAMALGRNL